jgi:uncharacterized protein (UPF0548 family)
MFSLVKPSNEMIEMLLRQSGSEGLSYHFAGATRGVCDPPDGYDGDHNRICLGTGERVFTAACAALRRWRMFELGWVEVCNPDAPIQIGTDVLVAAQCFGFWWLNICRIIYVIDEPGEIRKFGFAYGTTVHHVERGEERFTIEWHDADDSVWYDICAFSQPAYWMVKLGYPLARRLQRKFARASKNAMLQAVRGCDAGD